jgi:hypothetical protein
MNEFLSNMRQYMQYLTVTIATGIMAFLGIRSIRMSVRQRRIIIGPLSYIAFIVIFYLLVFANRFGIIDVPELLQALSAGLHMYGIIVVSVLVLSLLRFIR